VPVVAFCAGRAHAWPQPRRGRTAAAGLSPAARRRLGGGGPAAARARGRLRLSRVLRRVAVVLRRARARRSLRRAGRCG
jgi:phage tail tape-measure protein